MWKVKVTEVKMRLSLGPLSRPWAFFAIFTYTFWDITTIYGYVLVLSAPVCNVILKLTQGQRSRSQRSNREKTQKRHFLPKSSMVFNQNFFRGSLKDNSTHITRVLIWCERSRPQRSRCVHLLDHYRDLWRYLAIGDTLSFPLSPPKPLEVQTWNRDMC